MSGELILFVVLVCIGFVAGSILERRHFRSLEERERETLGLPALSLQDVFDPEEVADAWLASGAVVVSIDYFKAVLSALQNFVGGDVGAYQSLLDRARREALLRMKAAASGADLIVNVRIETSSIAGKEGGSRKSVAGVEVFAYGTALRLKKSNAVLRSQAAPA